MLVRKPRAGILHTQFAVASDEQRGWDPMGECPPIAFSADGKTMAAQSAETVWFWNTETGEQGKPFAMRRELSSARMAFSGDGKYVALEGAVVGKWPGKRVLDVWDIAAARKTRGSSFQNNDDGFAVARSLAFLPDAQTLVSASKNEMAAWNVATSQVRVLPGRFARWPTVVAPCRGNRFAVDEYDPENKHRKITLWDATTLEPREVLWTPPASEPSAALIVAAVILLAVWAVRRRKTPSRQCAT
jgi:WD40 repeat protein